MTGWWLDELLCTLIVVLLIYKHNINVLWVISENKSQVKTGVKFNLLSELIWFNIFSWVVHCLTLSYFTMRTVLILGSSTSLSYFVVSGSTFSILLVYFKCGSSVLKHMMSSQPLDTTQENQYLVSCLEIQLSYMWVMCATSQV